MTSPIMIEPTATSGMKPAPQRIPAATDQNKKIKSIGSLIGVRKRTIDNAPTIPSDNKTFWLIPIMTSAVVNVMTISEILNEWE